MKNKSFIFIRTYYSLKKIFIINALLLTINCQIILPINFIPIFKINETTPSLIMRNLVNIRAYANLEIGTPKQFIQLPLDMDSNDFYISENGEYEFLNQPEKFSDIKFFNHNNSKSCDKIEEKEYKGDNFYTGIYYKDNFYFNNKNIELEFYLSRFLKIPESGGIGLQLWPIYEDTTSTINDERTFLKKLKNNNLINDYYWSIFYNSKDYTKNEGFILIGSLPHDLNKDLGYYKKEYFDPNYIKNINPDIWVDVIKYRIKFDEIYSFEGNNKENKIINENLPMNISRILNVELDYNFGGIQAPNRFLTYFKNYFEEYISKNECFYDSFYISSKKYFFYCKNDKNLISKIKQNFPGFNLLHRRLNFNFDIIADDLFLEKGNYIYLLMFFHSARGDDWIMGRPFLQKYQFIFNPDKKDITFYSNLNPQNLDNNNNLNKEYYYRTIVLIIVIIGSIIIILVLGYIIWKFNYDLKFLRKKRANELDDEYEYTDQKDLNSKDGLAPLNE